MHEFKMMSPPSPFSTPTCVVLKVGSLCVFLKVIIGKAPLFVCDGVIEMMIGIPHFLYSC